MAEGIKYQNQIRARKLAKTSIYLSVAGIVAGVLMLIIFIIFYVCLIGFISHSMQQ
jgi:tetrahydromethanopterin S-methyltransferase subunit F